MNNAPLLQARKLVQIPLAAARRDRRDGGARSRTSLDGAEAAADGVDVDVAAVRHFERTGAVLARRE